MIQFDKVTTNSQFKLRSGTSKKNYPIPKPLMDYRLIQSLVILFTVSVLKLSREGRVYLLANTPPSLN